MEANKIRKLIFSSTAAVYEPPATNTLFTEATPTGPVSVYGETKLIVEEIIKSFARTGKLESYAILRYFNVAGDAGLNYREDAAQNVFPIIASSLKAGTPFNIYGTDYDTKDGTCIRDYIHLRDLVTAHQKALMAEGSGVYNLGTGTGYSVRELVAAFNAELPNPLQVNESPRRPGDAPIVVADASLATKELNWTPEHTLPEMVRDTLRVYFD
jgi:UDP-glucose 4-epimerase